VNLSHLYAGELMAFLNTSAKPIQGDDAGAQAETETVMRTDKDLALYLLRVAKVVAIPRQRVRARATCVCATRATSPPCAPASTPWTPPSPFSRAVNWRTPNYGDTYTRGCGDDDELKATNIE
jgi:hypothetical protein